MFGIRQRYLDRFAILFVATIYGFQNVLVHAQNGTCVCQPGEIMFTLDLTLSCDNNTIVPGLPGIEDAVCFVTTGGAVTMDEIPVSVSLITVTEVDRDINVLRSVNFTDAVATGDSFTYMSYSVTETDSVANGTIPNGLRVAIAGLNAANEEIVNNFVILYTNDCTIYPVLDTGSSIGWMSLVRTCYLKTENN
jgi:hypothetical protein